MKLRGQNVVEALVYRSSDLLLVVVMLAVDGDGGPTHRTEAEECGQAKKPKKRIEGQREMPLPIAGKGPPKEAVRKPRRSSGRKAGTVSGKLIKFDDETFAAFNLLRQDRRRSFQQLADEAFEDDLS